MRKTAGFLDLIISSAFLFAFPYLSYSQARSIAVPAGFVAKVDEYMQAQTKLRRFTGSILVAREGKVLVSRGYGFANSEWDVPNTPTTKFRLGSITKQFTSMVVMQLQEQGRLSVQDPICRYLSPCPESWKPVTIHHLLTHTSGIPSYTSLSDYPRKMMIPASREEMVARFRDLPLEFTPGDQYKYDNSGYFLLGLIIEKITGKPYEDVVRGQILEPLGMNATGYDHSEAILKRRAAGYVPSGGGLANAAYLDMAQPYAAGSLYSTVEDLLLWDQALYTEKLLHRASLDAMFTPFKSGYAYGWTIRPASPATFDRRQIVHGGGINGFATFIARYPDEKVTVIVLCNNEKFDVGSVAADLAAILFDARYEIPVERKLAKVDPRIYDSYVGEYELTPGIVLTVTREENRLMMQANTDPKVEVFPESEMKFFLKAFEWQITFVKDKDGRVTALILHRSGRDQTAKRIK